MSGGRDEALRTLLAQHPGQFVPIREIALGLYGRDDRDSANAARSLIHNVRQRRPGLIESVPRFGYRLVLDAPTVDAKSGARIALSNPTDYHRERERSLADRVGASRLELTIALDALVKAHDEYDWCIGTYGRESDQATAAFAVLATKHDEYARIFQRYRTLRGNWQSARRIAAGEPHESADR